MGAFKAAAREGNDCDLIRGDGPSQLSQAGRGHGRCRFDVEAPARQLLLGLLDLLLAYRQHRPARLPHGGQDLAATNRPGDADALGDGLALRHRFDLVQPFSVGFVEWSASLRLDGEEARQAFDEAGCLQVFEAAVDAQQQGAVASGEDQVVRGLAVQLLPELVGDGL